METRYPDQKLLVAVNEWGFAVVLTAVGEGAIQQCKDYSMFPEDLFENEDQVPREAGFYLWTGELYINDGQQSASETVDPDIRWNGEFARADGIEVAAFNRQLVPSVMQTTGPFVEVKDERGTAVSGFTKNVLVQSDQDGIFQVSVELTDKQVNWEQCVQARKVRQSLRVMLPPPGVPDEQGDVLTEECLKSLTEQANGRTVSVGFNPNPRPKQ